MCVCVLCVWVVSPFARSRVLAIDIFHHRWTGSGMKWLCLYCFIAERRRVAGMSNNICNKTNMQTCRLIQVCGGCFHVFWAATASDYSLTVVLSIWQFTNSVHLAHLSAVKSSWMRKIASICVHEPSHWQLQKKKWHQTNWLAIAMKQTCTSFLFLFFFLCLDESPEHGHRIAITWINGSGNHSQSISRLIKLTRQKGVRMSAASSVFFFLNIFCCFIEFHLSVLRHTHQTNRSYTTYTWIRKFNSV